MRLKPRKERVCLGETKCEAPNNQWKSTQHDQTKLTVETKHKEYTSKHQHRGTDHTAHELRDEILNLCDVVGYSCYERTRSKPIDLRERKGHNVTKTVFSDLVSDVLPRHVNEHVIQRTAKTAEQHKTNHDKPKAQDQMKIANTVCFDPQHTVVHDLAHDLGLDQVHHDLTYHKQRGENCVR